MSKDFFENLKPWSQRKHRLLTKYLPPFSAKVARTSPSREIFIIDGFAGAAAYDDGAEGSPILIARFGDVCLGWSNPVTLKLINVEADKNREGIFDSLEQATREWVKLGRIKNIKSDFGRAVPSILSIIGHAPALFFVDPFGPTDIRFDDLKAILLRRPAVTELIINFDQDGLRRIVDAALSTKTNPKAAETNAANISAIIGSDNWRNKIEGVGMSSAEAEEVLLQEYLTNLSAFGFAVVAYPVREELRSKPKYHFVYCTRHPDGLCLMNDFIREEEDLLYGDHVEGELPLFAEEASLANAVRKRREELSTVIEEYLRDRNEITRGRLKVDLVRANFGMFHTKDYNAVVQELLSADRLTETSGKRRVNDNDVLRINRG
jgi:three-Cys-motif partner protein